MPTLYSDIDPRTQGYQSSPPPRRGQGAYGLVPGNLQTPDPFADLANLYPNLSGANAQVSRDVMSQLKGELSPETIAAIQDDAARFGITSGMPGSELAGRRGVRSLGLNVENLQNQGQQNFLAATTGIRQNQILDPALRSAIAERNATFNAAPDPQAAADEARRRFYEGLGATGTGGGGVTYSGGRGIPPAPRPPETIPGSLVARGTRPEGVGAISPAGLGPAGGTRMGDAYYGARGDLPLYPGQNPVNDWLDAYGLSENFDSPSTQGAGNFQFYDPFFSGYGPNQNIDYGAGGYGDTATPVYDQQQYDPFSDYGGGSAIDYGTEDYGY